MMFAENRKISLRQLQVLLLLDCFGTAVLFLPAELAQESGQACWLAALTGGIIFVLLSLLLSAVGRRNPYGTAVEWFQGYFGKVFGLLLLLALEGKLLFDGLLELRIFSEIICRAMLPATPVWIISLSILAVAGAIAVQGLECRGRTAEVLFFAVVIPLAIILAAVAVSSEYRRVLPLDLPSVRDIRTGFSALSIVFQGLVFLYFIFPDLEKPEKASKAVWKSSLLTTLAVTVIVFLCLAVFGAGGLSEKLLPTLQMMERVSFTGVFLTRQDVLLLWFWMASVCVFLSGVLFYGAQTSVRMLHQPEEKRTFWLLVWLVALFGLSFLPENLSAAYRLRLQVAPWTNLIFLLIVPAVLLFFSRKGGENHA